MKYCRFGFLFYFGQVPKPVSPSEHAYKYSLVYIVNRLRVVGYDNERGKGDHKHIQGTEYNYTFQTPAQLIGDFYQDIEHIEIQGIKYE